MGLQITSLSCTRAGRRILHDVSLACPAGQAVRLTGPNGVGKSTLLRAVAGLLPLSAGSVTLNGTDLSTDRDSFHLQIAYTGHLDAIKPQLSVIENLSVWARVFGSDRLDETLETFNLTKLADRPAFACSAGQKRRLGLARLLLADRALWLMDEPTVSLDADTVAMIETAIANHLGTGGMALIATHLPLNVPGSDFALTPASQAPSDPFLMDRL